MQDISLSNVLSRVTLQATVYSETLAPEEQYNYGERNEIKTSTITVQRNLKTMAVKIIHGLYKIFNLVHLAVLNCPRLFKTHGMNSLSTRFLLPSYEN